ncbi:MaoC/PaaZ C-terminal domain-containing protein [[Anoxybacillus] calidus]|uniref:MaoC/PaaZ C-terminal domain-containing protein n=1 Tax=[Anoxybacillus] calidus TaxID=575178 RepID=UPI0015EB9570
MNILEESDLQSLSKLVPSVPYNEIQIGDCRSITKTITNEDIVAFAKLTGDINPIHLDEEYAQQTHFKERIAHGLLTTSYISTVIGTKLPGKGAIYLSQHIRFKAPVKIGDTLTIIGKVINKQDDKKIITLETNVINQYNQLVVEGQAVIMKME